MSYSGSGDQVLDSTYMLQFTKQNGFRAVLGLETLESVLGSRCDGDDRLDWAE